MKKIIILTCIIIMALSLHSQEVRTLSLIKNGDVKELVISGIDWITFSNFSVPNTPEGVLINGVVWATCNVDMPGNFASQPNEAGMFYQWNRNIGWSSADPMVNSNGGTVWNSSVPTGNSWETANNPCPTGWRLPTMAEQQSLVNSDSFWGKLDGVSGRFFGTGEQKVFFPAAGYRSGYYGDLSYVNYYGYYWSGEPHSEYNDQAFSIYFQNNYTYADYRTRTYGCSVRCVLE